MFTNTNRTNNYSLIRDDDGQLSPDLIRFLDFSHFSYLYLTPCIIGFSFVTNLICCSIFTTIIRKQKNDDSSKMWRYLFLKSICDTLSAFMVSFFPAYGCNECFTLNTYVMQVWYIWFYRYFTSVFLLASAAFETAATFDCAITIDKKMQFCQKNLSFGIISAFIFIFCLTFESFWLFSFKIQSDAISSSQIIHLTLQTDFYKSQLASHLRFAHSMLRDFLVQILLFIINVYILYKLREVRKRKNALQNKMLIKKDSSTAVVRHAGIEKAHTRKIKMIMILCCNYILGHLPITIFYLPIGEKRGSLFWNYWGVFSNLIYSISLSITLFVYFFFNKQFKSVLISKIPKIFKQKNNSNPLFDNNNTQLELVQLNNSA
jgi:hypothetical protein